MKYKYGKKDNLLEKKRMVDGKVVKTVNNEYDDENILVNHRDPSGLVAGEDKIDGGGGGSLCPDYDAFDTLDECMEHWSEDYCRDKCYDDSDGSGGGGDSGYWQEVYDQIKQSLSTCMGKCSTIGCIPICLGVTALSGVGGIACSIICPTGGCAMFCAAVT